MYIRYTHVIIIGRNPLLKKDTPYYKRTSYRCNRKEPDRIEYVTFNISDNIYIYIYMYISSRFVAPFAQPHMGTQPG